MTLSEFVDQSLDAEIDEFMTLLKDPRPRSESDWWYEFIAFIGKRQSILSGPSVLPDVSDEHGRP